jgi:hypothetical protein
MSTIASVIGYAVLGFFAILLAITIVVTVHDAIRARASRPMICIGMTTSGGGIDGGNFPK